MFKFGVILLASHACAVSLPPCPMTGTGLKTPPVPSNCHRAPIVIQEIPQLPNQSPCQCAEDKKQVCGTDGKTYPNSCSLNCAKAKNSALKKDHDGQCTIEAQKVPQLPNQSSCQCTEEKNPVCGTDGKTYPNQCSLNCERAKNPALKKDHDGQCTVVAQKVPELSPCACTKYMKPVCGSDNITYNNICLLKCAANTKPVEKKSHGPCAATKGVKPSRHNCACPHNYLVVCGSDGHTYSNECELKCVSNDKPGLTKAHDGPCKVPQTGGKS